MFSIGKTDNRTMDSLEIADVKNRLELIEKLANEIDTKSLPTSQPPQKRRRLRLPSISTLLSLASLIMIVVAYMMFFTK